MKKRIANSKIDRANRTMFSKGRKNETRKWGSLSATPEMRALLPPIAPELKEQLRQMLIQTGTLIYPLIINERGELIDGLQTWELGLALGWHTRRVHVVVLPGLSRDEMRWLRLSLNVNRRHLSNAAKRQLAIGELAKRPDLSARQLATIVGLSNSTISALKTRLVQEGVIPDVPTHASDGRVFSKPITALHVPLIQLKRVNKLVSEVEVLPPGNTSPRLLHHARTLERRAAIAELGKTINCNGDAELIHADFRQLLTLRPELIAQADLAFFDPAWTPDAMDLHEHASLVASQLLKCGRMLVTYLGSIEMPTRLLGLGKHLQFITELHLCFGHGGKKSMPTFGSLTICQTSRSPCTANRPIPRTRSSS